MSRFIFILLLLASSGCTHVQLRRSMLRQHKTLADIQCQQVLDNVARFVANSRSMPYFAYAATGSTQVVDSGSVSPTFTWTQLSQALGLTASRTLTESWGTVPINNPDKLYAMRCAYQVLVNGSWDECDTCIDRLAQMLGPRFKENPECYIPMGWFSVGGKHDVPRHCVCYVSSYCDTYVWVMPEGMDGLTKFTMTILDIATLSSAVGVNMAQVPPVPNPLEPGAPPLRPRDMPYVQPGPMFFPQPTR